MRCRGESMDENNSKQMEKLQACRLPLRELPLPGAGQVHLWFLDLVRLGSPLQPGHDVNPNDFPPRMQRTLRRFYLRLLLGAYLGIAGKDVVISRAVRGKPKLDRSVHKPVLDFSTANSRGCCLVGISAHGLVGVDLEPANRRAGRPMAVARRYFSEREASELSTMEEGLQDRAFLHTWACKEAVVKAAGHGIANRLYRFSVDVHPDRPPRIVEMLDDDPAAWRLAVFSPVPGHFGAVALRQSVLELKFFRLDPAA